MTKEPTAQTQDPVNSEPVSALESPVIEEKKPKKKWLVPTIVAVALVATSAAGYFFYQNMQLKKQVDRQPEATQTESIDSTADWLTYENKTHGFLLKHPSDFFISDMFLAVISEEASRSSRGLAITNERYKTLGQAPHLYLTIVRTSKTPREFIDFDHDREIASWEERGKGMGYDKPVIKTIEDVKGNSIEAVRVERVREPSAPNEQSVQFFFKNDGLLYILGAEYGTPGNLPQGGIDEKTAVELVFSTFKFLDGESEWQSYVHDNLLDWGKFKSFKLLYPKSWSYSEQRFEEPQGFILTLTSGDSEMKISQVAGGGGGCLYPEDPEKDGMYDRYGEYKEFQKNGQIWRMAKQLAGSGYTVCQKGEQGFIGITDIGTIGIILADTNALTEIEQIIEKIEISN